MITNDSKKDGLIFVAKLLLIGLVLLAFNYSEFGTAIKSVVGVYAEPVSYWSGTTGKSVNEFFYSITDFGQTEQKYNDLIVEYAKKEAELAQLTLIAEENEALKKQLQLSNPEKKYAEATVMSSGLFDKGDYLLINKGVSNEINIGDVAVLGNIYLGRVSEIGQSTAKILTPYSTRSSLLVGIVNVNLGGVSQEKVQNLIKDAKYYEGVALGSISGIRVENIPVKADIPVGSYVFVNDEKVGQYLVLGKIKEVNGSASDASKTAIVEPVIDYNSLKYIFLVK